MNREDIIRPTRPFTPDLRDMAFVPRWVILRRNRQQYLAEHSYFVAVYADQLARLIGWTGDYAALMRYALWHDIEETITGDIPGPAKRVICKDRSVTPGAMISMDRVSETARAKFGNDFANDIPDDKGTHAIVSMADSIEEMSYLNDEEDSGNNRVHSIRLDAWNRLESKLNALPCDHHTQMTVYQKHLRPLWMPRESGLHVTLRDDS